MSTGLCLLMVTVCLAQVADFTETGHQSINQKQAAGAIKLIGGKKWIRIPLAEEWERFRTHLFGHLIRLFVGFERRWYDLLSQSSPFAVNAAIGVAYVLTFIAIWLPLSALVNAITLGLPLLLPRSAIEVASGG